MMMMMTMMIMMMLMEEEEDDEVEEDDVEEVDRSQDPEAHFVRACAGHMRMDISREPFCMEIYRRNDRGHLRGHRLCEPAQSKCTYISQGPFCLDILRENDKRPGDHLDQEPGLNCYRKNPSEWPRCLGKKRIG